ncbi:hypothetical protein B0H14DRAFT_3546654 [Mycena olivaceomarginata]|nr:hypothetical protein B0H14DRAFT_3546654 [Mycena olivaceomarginata]
MSVILDDSDPLVDYSGRGWLGHPGEQFVEFGATTHSSGTPGDTATLKFEGTSISVYGTLVPGRPIMNFSIDGAEPTPLEASPVKEPSHNILFWTSSALMEAPHTLTITVTFNTTDITPETLFLDYFVYKTASAASKTILVDDSDPSLIYSPDWQRQDDCDTCIERTQHVSASAGAWVAFNFEGSQISLNGSAKDNELSVLVDGIIQPTTFSLPVARLPNNLSHTINITTLGGNVFAIDTFTIVPTLEDVDSSVSSSPTSRTNASPGSTSSQLVAGAKTSKPTPIAAIVGATVGAFLILSLILVSILLRKRWVKSCLNHQSTAPNPLVSPFVSSLNGGSAEPPQYKLKYVPVVRV